MQEAEDDDAEESVRLSAFPRPHAQPAGTSTAGSFTLSNKRKPRMCSPETLLHLEQLLAIDISCVHLHPNISECLTAETTARSNFPASGYNVVPIGGHNFDANGEPINGDMIFFDTSDPTQQPRRPAWK